MALRAAELKTGQVRGLIPAMDPLQVQEPFVIDGSNFIVDLEGPKAYFGGSIYTYSKLHFGDYAQTFKVGANHFVANENGFWEFDTTEKRFYPKFLTSTIANAYPWSMARVGGAYYFARKDTGLFEYIVSTETWTEITTDVPPNPHAVTESNGRLICVGEDVLAWSEISNGANFTTDVDLGIGAQSLAVIGFGDVLGVYKLADGFVTFTSSGVLKSKFIDGINPYFHSGISRTEVPISAFVISELSQGIVCYISINGFNIITSKGIEAWQPIMSSYLTQHTFKITAYETSGVYALQYLPEVQLLFMSIAANDEPFNFTIAYVLYVPKDDWGSYNREHTNFGILPSAFFSTRRLTPVVFKAHGDIHEIGALSSYEDEPSFIETVVFHGDPAPQPRHEVGINVFPSGINYYTADVTAFVNPGVYDDLLLTSLPHSFVGLDSSITVGLLRVADQVYPDTLNYFTELAVGSKESGADHEFIDWLLIADAISDEDWLALSGTEDWGFNIVDVVSYNIDFEGTLNGADIYENQTETLVDYIIENNLRVYKPYISGIYGRVTITAEISGESFHLKYLSATGNIGGRL